MRNLRRKSRHERRYKSAADWPDTQEIDGYYWNIAPEADAAMASQLLNEGGQGDTDEQPPDSYYEDQAGKSEARRFMDDGIRPF